MTTSMGEVQDHFKMTDGFDLSFRHWGTLGEVKRVVVCIHGIGEHSEFFRSIGQNLASDGGAEVYAIDLRGFGNSKEEGLSIGDTSNFKKYLQDVAEVVEYVRAKHPGKKLFMFGHSMGGLHTLWYAANKPNPPDGVILAGSSVTSRAGKVSVADTSLLIRFGIPLVFNLLFARKAMFDIYKPALKKFKKSQEFKDYQESLVNDSLYSGKFSWRYLASTVTLLRKAPRNAARTNVPTLMIQGGADGIVAPTGAKKIFEKLPSKDKLFRTFADADHYFYHVIFPTATSKYDLGQKKQVTNAIGDWLKTH